MANDAITTMYAQKAVVDEIASAAFAYTTFLFLVIIFLMILARALFYRKTEHGK
jgi:hypothetical protein